MIVATVIDRAGETLGGFLPRLGGAFALLLIGLVAARILRRIVVKVLDAAGVDELAERWRINEALARASINRPLSALIGSAVRFAVSLIVIFSALSLLGLQALTESLNQGVLLLPRLLVAAALVLAGVVLAQLVRDRLERLSGQMDLPLPVAKIAELVVIAVFAVTALAQVGVSADVLTGLVTILIAAVALTFALAFGLGGREVARSVSAGRYVRGAFQVGQNITTPSARGEIVAIEPSSTVLRAVDGSTIRVPNHILLETVVTVAEEPEREEADAE